MHVSMVANPPLAFEIVTHAALYRISRLFSFLQADLCVFPFDCLYVNGEVLLHKTLADRRKVRRDEQYYRSLRLSVFCLSMLVQPALLSPLKRNVSAMSPLAS
jgi:hypothetical protein